MGKRKKRMIMKKYAKKYALQRKTLGFDKEAKMIEIDMLSGEEIKQEEDVQVVINTPEQIKEKKQAPTAVPGPELQVVQIEEPVVEEAPPPVEVKKPAKKTATRKSTARKSSTRKRATKKTEE
jgi:hypothetical protein